MFNSEKCALLRLCGILLALTLTMSGCAPAPSPGKDGLRVLVDGEEWTGASSLRSNGDALRVYITCDGRPLLDLPFGEPHSVQIIQADGAMNAVAITGDAVFMERADCENQDCVQMGAVTRENLELRVMGGFIICLPHRISVEVRDG